MDLGGTPEYENKSSKRMPISRKNKNKVCCCFGLTTHRQKFLLYTNQTPNKISITKKKGFNCLNRQRRPRSRRIRVQDESGMTVALWSVALCVRGYQLTARVPSGEHRPKLATGRNCVTNFVTSPVRLVSPSPHTVMIVRRHDFTPPSHLTAD